jgi:3'-5' exoribonuclease
MNTAEESQTVATLRDGQKVAGVFACARKERRLSRAGAPYLTVVLRDRTGTILARAFRDADLLAGRFEQGDLVRVEGRAERFRDRLQIELREIARAEAAEADPEGFLPVAYRDLDELEGFFEHLARELYEPGLSALLERVLGDEQLRAGLRKAPCSVPAAGRAGGSARTGAGADAGADMGAGTVTGTGTGAHHAYLGGMLEHTVAVASLVLELCTIHPRLDRDLLLAAALLHDIGKVREFTYGAEIARGEEGKLLGHLELGLRVLAPLYPSSLPAARRRALEHCILAHHGPEALPGGRFAFPEAIALYRCNAVDAHLKGAFEHGS